MAYTPSGPFTDVPQSQWASPPAGAKSLSAAFFNNLEAGVTEALTRVGTDTGWLDITISSGFAATSTVERPQVRKIGSIVHARGLFSNTGLTASASFTIGTLPDGLQPGIGPSIIVAVGSSSGAATATVFFNPGGSVTIRTGATLGAYYSIGGHSWLVD